MKESRIVLIIVIILFLLGIGVSFFSIFSDFSFNFYKTEISVNGAEITEKVYFKPNKDYHTLFRNFQDKVYTGNIIFGNYIEIENVECSDGKAYSKDFSGKITGFPEKNKEYIAYTENNEYGCSFGSNTGFKKGSEYWSKAEYKLHPENLFLIDGQYYIKFVAYSRNKHKFLLRDSNFIVNGNAVAEKISFPSDYTIIYIPYNGDTFGFNIIRQGSFEFDSRILNKLFIFLISLFPGLVFFGLWFFFGAENVYADVPEELSVFPYEADGKKNWRKGWEVAAYFNPPFSVTDNNFFSALLLNFYHKKVIDIQMKDKKMFIKINHLSHQLDDVESKFLEILKGVEKRAPEKYKDRDYFNLEKALQSFSVRYWAQSEFRALSKKVKNEGKKYLSKKADYFILPIFLLIILFTIDFVNNTLGVTTIFLVVSLIIISLINHNSAILASFKKDFYAEYQHWQAFKKYLNGSFAMRHEEHKAVVLWDHYLIYSTALGVSAKVIKQLKNWHVIDESHYNIYMGINTASYSFAHSGGSSGHGSGGGFGGGGGGGVGGGGGGGR